MPQELEVGTQEGADLRAAVLAKIRAEAPRFLYKYREGSQQDLDAIAAGKIWIPAACKLGDPHDANLEIRTELAEEWEHRESVFERDHWGEIVNECFSFGSADPLSEAAVAAIKERARQLKERVRHFGVYCLSATGVDAKMWTNFANKFEGICIEYPYMKEIFDTRDGSWRVNKVNYVAEYPRIDLGLLEREPPGLGHWKLFFHKAEDYEYEREWRYVEPKGGEALFDQPVAISRIIFGLRCSEEKRDAIRRLCVQKQPRIKCAELRTVRGSYAYEMVDMTS